jgi:hypothetical protein
MRAKKKTKPVPKAKAKKKPVRERRSTPDTSDRSTRARKASGRGQGGDTNQPPLYFKDFSNWDYQYQASDPKPVGDRIHNQRRSTPDTSDRSTRARKARKPGPVPDTDWHATFIYQLREFPNVSAACIACNITRETAYTHRKLYPEFAKAWEEAEEMSVDALEEACYKRAKEGYEEPIYQQGEMVGTKLKFSDTLACLILKGRRPLIYGDKSTLDINGKIELTDEDVVVRGRAATAGILSALAASVKGVKA